MTAEAELKKFLTEVTEFIKILESKRNHVEEIMGKLKESVRIIRNQLETYTVCKRALVPPRMLKKLPDVKQRLLSKLHLNVEEEIKELTRYVDELIAFKEDLQKRSNKIESLATDIVWKEHRQYLYASCRLVEWIQGCWKYFSLICMNLQIGLTTLRMDHDPGSWQLEYKDTFHGTDKEFVFNNRELRIFKMMLVDVSSRSKISVKSVKPSAVTQ